jgi:hypothetical protein
MRGITAAAPPLDGHAPKKSAKIHPPCPAAIPPLSALDVDENMVGLPESVGRMPVADDVAQGFLPGPGASSRQPEFVESIPSFATSIGPNSDHPAFLPVIRRPSRWRRLWPVFNPPT